MFGTRQQDPGREARWEKLYRELDDPERVKDLWSTWFILAEPQDPVTDT